MANLYNSAKECVDTNDVLSFSTEERFKAKVVENYQRTSALMRERLKLFFAQLLLLTSSVSTEQSQIRVKNTKPAL